MGEEGARALDLPIRGLCDVPRIALSPHRVDFSEVFLRAPYASSIELRNTSTERAARFVVSPLEAQLRALADVRVSPAEGVLLPGARIPLEVTLRALQNGPLSLPLEVIIVGGDGAGADVPLGVPLPATAGGAGVHAPVPVPGRLSTELVAVSRGPRLAASPGALDFGSVPCIAETSDGVEILNESDIPARVS
jgi:hypothetical protein